MMDGGGEIFWILSAVAGVIMLGGGLALSMVRERELTDEERAASDEATRRLYAEEARDGAR
ncbi:hypothetical protein ACFOWB_21345 [Chenggangzhangella methanolivorans]|uniref:hypothetical protein n=1 Tax=Chenggangzhangella methanolivorans TaxID=1437009 RepID=UPI0036197C2C